MTDLQLPPITALTEDDRGPANGVDELGRCFDFDEIFPEARGPHELDPPGSVLDAPASLWPVELPMQTQVLERSDRADDPTPIRRLAELLREESKLVKNAALRKALLGESGRLLLQHFDDAEVGQALVSEADCAGTKEAAALTTEVGEDLHKRLSALASEANNRSLGAADRAAAWIEHGLLCEQRIADIKRAFESYKSALSYAPNHPIANPLATGAALLMGRKTDARKLIEQAIRRRLPENLTAALLVDLAEITDDPGKRRGHLEHALRLVPKQETALRRLIRVVRGADEPTTLAELYRKLASLAKDPTSVSNALLAGLTALSDLGGDSREKAAKLTGELLAELATWISRHPDEASARGPLHELIGYMERRGVENLTPAQRQTYLEALGQLAPLVEDRREQALLREQLARVLWRQFHPTVRADKLEFREQPKSLSKADALAYDILIDNLRRSREHLPERRWLWETLAAALFERGDRAGLISHLENWATAQSPGGARAEILLHLGRANEYVLADYPRAGEIYELAVAEDPRNADGLRALGKVYEHMGRWSDAVATLQRQAAETSDSSERLTVLRQLASMAEHQLGDIDLAIATLQEVAVLDEQDTLSLYQLAALCRTHERTKVLVDTLEQLVARLQDDIARTAALAKLGETLLATKEHKRAIAALERALKLTPGYTPALQLLSKLYRESGDFEALLKLQLPEVDPIRDPAILALKSGRVCFEEIGDIERGIEFLSRSYQLNPDLTPGREILLQLLQASGKISEAYDLLRAQDPPETPALKADVHYRLGLLAEALARQDERDKNLNRALQHYRATLEIQPKHGLAFERARMLLVRLHDVDNLIRLLENALQNLEGEEQLPLLVQLGRLHMTKLPEQFEKARRAYERALEVAPRDGILRREYENLLRQVDDQKDLPAQRLALAGISEDTHYKATLLVESAESLLTSDANREDREFAANAILGALREDPGNPYAVRQLEGLLSDPNSPLTMTDAVGARAVRAQSDAERAIFYLESAELLEWSGAQNEAQRAYKAALRAIPGLAPAEDGLRRLATGRRETSGAQAKAKAVSVHTLMAEAREAAVVAGNSGEQEDAEHALMLLGQILGRDPHYRDAIGLTRALVSQLADPKPALNLLSTVFGRITEVGLRYELGVFLGEQTEDKNAAVAYFQVASEAREDGKQ
ncbi:MAG: tetratricopeptide repeat protein, partial [Nannocystaceae bacterium]